MAVSLQLLTLGRYLAGEFDNQQQSLNDPAWYVHLKVWYRPVRLFVEDSLTFFLEQVSVASGQPPYRQRVLRLQERQGQLIGQFYGLRAPLKFRGGGMLGDPSAGATAADVLSSLTEAELTYLPTCCLTIECQSLGPDPLGCDQYSFKGTLPADTLCAFEYNGNTGYVSLGFTIGSARSQASAPLELRVYDKGIDPATGKGLWGALMGPFCLLKQVDFSEALPS